MSRVALSLHVSFYVSLLLSLLAVSVSLSRWSLVVYAAVGGGWTQMIRAARQIRSIYTYVTPEELSAPDSYSRSPTSYSGAKITEELFGVPRSSMGFFESSLLGVENPE
eukprot:scaffold3473_cov122-Isochrysis_galbana.AAC.12